MKWVCITKVGNDNTHWERWPHKNKIYFITDVAEYHFSNFNMLPKHLWISESTDLMDQAAFRFCILDNVSSIRPTESQIIFWIVNLYYDCIQHIMNPCINVKYISCWCFDILVNSKTANGKTNWGFNWLGIHYFFFLKKIDCELQYQNTGNSINFQKCVYVFICVYRYMYVCVYISFSVHRITMESSGKVTRNLILSLQNSVCMLLYFLLYFFNLSHRRMLFISKLFKKLIPRTENLI